jgi:hypothetical protein
MTESTSILERQLPTLPRNDSSADYGINYKGSKHKKARN